MRKDPNVSKVLNEHTKALRERLRVDEVGCRLYVMFDEWLDSIGNAVCAVTVGCGDQRYVADVIFLKCKGANRGVEHDELGKAVNDTISQLGIRFVLGFLPQSYHSSHPDRMTSTLSSQMGTVSLPPQSMILANIFRLPNI